MSARGEIRIRVHDLCVTASSDGKGGGGGGGGGGVDGKDC